VLPFPFRTEPAIKTKIGAEQDVLPLKSSGRLRFERQVEQGAWKPGDKLPTERALVAQFGIARNILRKSLDRLEASGKITRPVGRGTFVAEITAAEDGGDVLIMKILRASPAEIMDVRLMIEPQAGELSAASATIDDFAALEECLRRSEAAADIAMFEAWDGSLHQKIVDTARNQLLSDIYAAVNNVRNSSAWGKLKTRSLTAERRALYLEQHRAIVAALRNRDPDLTRELIRAHLLSVKKSFGGY
jgi:DNA-binding FadR family transcriptional regulator